MPSPLIVTPVSELGALPFAVEALTPKLAASWVDWPRLRLMLAPLGTVRVTGEPVSNAPLAWLKVNAWVASGPDE